MGEIRLPERDHARVLGTIESYFNERRIRTNLTVDHLRKRDSGIRRVSRI